MAHAHLNQYDMMRVILTFDSGNTKTVEILKMPEKLMTAKDIEDTIKDWMNAHLKVSKVIKTHLLRN